MIYTLNGIIEEIHEHAIIVAVAGVGFGVLVPFPNSFSKEQKIFLYIVFHWNQEQGPTLYGFKTQIEKSVFSLITSCSGIGPKIALSVLRDLTPQEFIESVEQKNIDSLSKVNGIGRKKAEQIIVHLKHKIASYTELINQSHTTGASKYWKDVALALGSLNYTRIEIQTAREYIQGKSLSNSSFDEILRLSLSFLSKKL